MLTLAATWLARLAAGPALRLLLGLGVEHPAARQMLDGGGLARTCRWLLLLALGAAGLAGLWQIRTGLVGQGVARAQERIDSARCLSLIHI